MISLGTKANIIYFQTVTTWFKNQRCRLPKILRKQLLEVNGQKALTRTVPNVPKINTPALNSDSSFIQSGLQFPFYQNPEMESNLDGLKSVMLSKDKMQKALAQILQMQKGKSMADDLDSNGTKTPEAIMETDDKETNDKIDESVDVEEIEEVSANFSKRGTSSIFTPKTILGCTRSNKTRQQINQKQAVKR